MRSYLCIVDTFQGVKQVFLDCISRAMYTVCDEYTQKGPYRDIRKGDLLFLIYKKQFRGYAYAAGEFKNGTGDYEGWKVIDVEGGWCQVREGLDLPHGYYVDNVIEGTKRSVVKMVNENWAMERLQDMKMHSPETSIGRSHFVNIVELAHHSRGKNPYYAIPEVQRGLVWNPVRCEVLWDSIIRGLPIGAISVRRSEDGGHLDIFDGQQRTNTISLGYVEWKEHSPCPEEKDRPLLWLDLGADQDCVDLDEGQDRRKSTRKYIFRITTAAHPWGYKLTDNETKDTILPVRRQKVSVEAIKGLDWERKSDWERKDGCVSARPHPGELWPVDAKVPVPFTILRQYVDRNSSPAWDCFIAWCREKYAETNWVKHFYLDERPQLNDEIWKKHVEAIKNLSKQYVVCLNADQVAESDIGLYFKRMNTGGVPLDDEEISYSLLKSKIRGLKTLDSCATGRCMPSRLASIAIRLWLSKENSWKWYASVTHAQIEEVARNETSFRNYLRNDFVVWLGKMEELLRVNKENGLLKWHIRSLFNLGNGCLVIYLMREIALGQCERNYVALVTYVCWFSSDVVGCVRSLWNAKSLNVGIYDAINNGQLYRLFYPNEIEDYFKQKLQKLEDGSVWDSLVHTADASVYFGEAMSSIWNGFNGKQGCELLLFATRRFINRVFKYDLERPEWQGENRPWDYDHILPKAWIGDRRVSPYTYLLRDCLWSIGNSAPIPFSLNRGKSDFPPGECYPDSTDTSAQELFINTSGTGRFQKSHFKDSHGAHWDRLDRCFEDSRDFIELACSRFKKIVNDGWYKPCNVEDVVKIEGRYNDMKVAAMEIERELGEMLNGAMMRTYFWGSDGHMHPVLKDLDWARHGIVSGIECAWRGDDNVVHDCLLAIAWGREKIEVGLYRHPTSNDIDGDTNQFWFKSPSTFDKFDKDSIVLYCKDLIESCHVESRLV